MTRINLNFLLKEGALLISDKIQKHCEKDELLNIIKTVDDSTKQALAELKAPDTQKAYELWKEIKTACEATNLSKVTTDSITKKTQMIANQLLQTKYEKNIIYKEPELKLLLDAAITQADMETLQQLTAGHPYQEVCEVMDELLLEKKFGESEEIFTTIKDWPNIPLHLNLLQVL